MSYYDTRCRTPKTRSKNSKNTNRKDIVGFFFFNDTATTEIYTLSLHDALPILLGAAGLGLLYRLVARPSAEALGAAAERSEEDTSELQSPCNLVFRLLLEKKKQLNYVSIKYSTSPLRSHCYRCCVNTSPAQMCL